MELVIDANIFVAALLKKGETRKLLLNDELILFEYPAACCGWDVATAERR